MNVLILRRTTTIADINVWHVSMEKCFAQIGLTFFTVQCLSVAASVRLCIRMCGCGCVCPTVNLWANWHKLDRVGKNVSAVESHFSSVSFRYSFAVPRTLSLSPTSCCVHSHKTAYQYIQTTELKLFLEQAILNWMSGSEEFICLTL